MTWILSGIQAQVEADIAAIDQLAITWWRNAGYTVMEEGDTPALISKINGVDALDLPRTTKWATPVLAPDGTWYAASPSIHSEWAVWKERLAAAGYQLQTQEIAMPQEWIIIED